MNYLLCQKYSCMKSVIAKLVWLCEDFDLILWESLQQERTVANRLVTVRTSVKAEWFDRKPNWAVTSVGSSLGVI